MDKVEQPVGPASFVEMQRFSQPWIWILTLPLCLGGAGWSIWGAIGQLAQGRPFGDEPMSNAGLLVATLIIVPILLGILWLIARARLHIEVHGDGLYLRFAPFHRRWRRIGWDQITRAEARTYRPILEYGGWGIRMGRHGWAYNVRGNRGLQLELAGGRRILIGSQQAERLEQAVATARR